MDSPEIEKSIQAAVASIEMEGIRVGPKCIALCKLMLSNRITIEEYLALVTLKEV